MSSSQATLCPHTKQMGLLFFTVVFVLLGLLTLAEATYTDKWAVRLDGDEASAKEVARLLGFRYVRPVGSGYHLLLHPDVPEASPHLSPEHQASLLSHPSISWAKQQEAKPLSRRDMAFNDPLWPQSWHLNGRDALDMGIKRAWGMGYSGKGVVVTIVDDGLETDHPDLRANYDPEASYDVCDDDPDPYPVQTEDSRRRQSHGTRCAGEVAAVANNGLCSLGVAFRAHIGGVRLVSCAVTDDREEQAFSVGRNHTDIYSVSWGPFDNGETVNGPNTLTVNALTRGVTEGRDGKGSIFVWASGNGGDQGDSCGLDGYVNSPFTLTVSASLRDGSVPKFSEPCAAIFISAFSSELSASNAIATTDGFGKCTTYHSGSSASAPLVAGVVALALEANPQMTWRDVQHLVVETANSKDLKGTWIQNGAGKNVSDHFGFGLIDAVAMVTKAKSWTTVPEWHICSMPQSTDDVVLPYLQREFIELATDACEGTETEVLFLEHVHLHVTLATLNRGSALIQLISPFGTRSTLMHRRPNDDKKNGLTNWMFSSVQFWGEDPRGNWLLMVESFTHSLTLKEWTLVLSGTSDPPLPEAVTRQLRNSPRPCLDCISKSIVPATVGESRSKASSATLSIVSLLTVITASSFPIVL